MKIYYESQDGWSKEDYYYLHRVLHRLFFYYKKNCEEIRLMEIQKMSEKTKVLIFCIIKYYGYDHLLDEFENLKPLKDTKPLRERLVLDDNPLPETNIYKDMNVAC
ncbi:MAG: hypothetical protein MJ131_01560 [Lachnospiraceae bacterium]|nr:hypothetical protein [Lachnospiraceae bacterium]